MLTIPGYDLIAPVCEVGDLVLYRATRLEDGQPVLLKFPAAPRPLPNLLRRLDQEYELARDLDSNRVVRPLALERHAGTAALVLEHGPDRSLASLLGSQMGIQRFLQIAIGITDALGELHGHELIHKDLKPEHILLNDEAHIWLTGLGIASRQPRERQIPEAPEAIAGTLAYMAPEQTGRMNRSIDARSDLYALGVNFYQMLTGVLPFIANDPMEWVHCHIARQPVPPAQRVPHLPKSLSEMVMKLLAKTAEERYQSTVGLAADLRHGLADWESKGCIDSFPLGEQDVSDRLLIPEKLYGRQAEIETLLAAFEQVVASGTTEIVLVSGYSGIGKTSVVHELHKAPVSSRGLFAAGKFDRFKRDIPYATLVQALQTLVRQILGKSEAEVVAWRKALQQAVSPNGQLIVSLLPEVELIIGPQPPVPNLPPQEAQNRFQMVLRRFLGAFAGAEHPLVLFLDDLQWLDAATLDLIEQLATGQEHHHLLLIGAYRDNEVGPAHPLMRIIEAIRKRGTGVREIVLAPLSLDDVGHLVADSLRCDRVRARPLAQLVRDKTGGNPFFAIQFLTALAEEKLLVFDPDAGGWTWDLARIHAKGFTDNVVDLMVEKLGRLPDETQEALKQFACLGSIARIATLTTVCGQAEDTLHAVLWEAARAGLIGRLEDSYAFLHDRVQEAAYALIPEDDRLEIHLIIGRKLLSNAGPEELSEILFDVVNHLNRGAELITDPDERARLAELDATAGRRARASVAYASAREFLVAAAALLPEDAWNTRYDFSFALYLDWAESEYLRGAFEEAERLFAILHVQAKNNLDKAAIYTLQLTVYPIAGKYDEAVTMGVRALRLLGEETPDDDEALERAIQAEAKAVKASLQDRKIAELARAPETTDARVKMVTGLLSGMGGPAYISRAQLYPFLIFRSLNYALKHGLTREASHAFSGYANLLVSRFDDPQSGYEFSQAALSLSERFGDLGTIGLVLYLHGNHINFWLNPFASDFPILERGFRGCLDAGNLVFANYIAYSIVWQALERGDTLGDVLDFSQQYASFALGSRNEAIHQSIVLEQQFLKCLMGKTDGDASFSEASISELSCVDKIAKASFTCGVAYYHTMKMMAAYLMGDDAASRIHADAAGKTLTAVNAQPMEAMYYFLHALVLTRACREAPEEDRGAILKTLVVYQEKLAIWAGNCPANFAGKHALVAAEIAEIEGDELSAERLFEQSIESSKKNSFVHWEAMANESAARFHAGRGLKNISRGYLCEAHARYARWGARGKLRQLEQASPELGAESPFAPGAHELDILAVTRASQAISGEILLDHLVETLMRTALTTAGAQKGYLLLTREEELTLAAEARVENQNVVVQVRSDPGFPESVLPVSILNYVRRSRDEVLLDDATSPHPYSADEYFSRQHPKSVLCFPITRQAKLSGLLYLENDLATHAFTPDRLAVLKLLAAQAAISLENALVYEALRQSEQKFRAIFDQTFQFIGVLSTDGIVLQANQTALQFAGVSANEVIGQFFWETAWWAHSPELQQRLRTAIQETAGGELVRFEATHTAPDGQVHYVDFSLKPVTDAEGRVVQLIPEGRDITDRKLAEEELRELNTDFVTLLENTGDFVYFKDRDNRFRFCSQTLANITGHRSWRDMIGKDDFEVFPEETARIYREEELPIFSEGKVLLNKVDPYFDAQGGRRWVNTNKWPVFDETGAVVGIFGISRDITEQKQAEEELRRVTLFRQTILNSAPYCIVSATPDGIITGFNPAAERLLGYTAAEVIGKKTPAIWHDPQEIKQHALRLSEELGEEIPPGFDVFSARPQRNLPEENEWIFIRKDGTRVPVNLSVTALRDEAGQIIGFVGMIYDLTERKQAQEKIRQLNEDLEQRVLNRTAQLEAAIKELEAFSYSVSHDLRAPLRHIAGYAELLVASDRETMSDQSFRYLDTIAGSAGRLGVLIDDLLQFSRTGRAEMKRETVDMNQTLQEVLIPIKESCADRSIEWKVGNLPSVLGDGSLLRQVWANLLGNAIKYTRPREAARVEVGTREENDETVFFVADNGVGFDMLYADKLFGVFQRLHSPEEFEGTGIGLATVQRIVTRHGGRIWAEAEIDNGATFYFTLPKKPEEIQ